MNQTRKQRKIKVFSFNNRFLLHLNLPKYIHLSPTLRLGTNMIQNFLIESIKFNFRPNSTIYKPKEIYKEGQKNNSHKNTQRKELQKNLNPKKFVFTLKTDFALTLKNLHQSSILFPRKKNKRRTSQRHKEQKGKRRNEREKVGRLTQRSSQPYQLVAFSPLFYLLELLI